ncbi:hypothetical protein [Alkaliphilus sp. B6464]|uniref:hypothetical protein n=1 Tax=Alkaliphilus sp. B6464 TaxID=2731219 RepID=UPI001BADD30B|nr:hypothetical protein [Alkaliphilus sp. B6464]QUH22014.1 hypothetical protein HYG84_19100 [Alkaliphilus sp. B6464]
MLDPKQVTLYKSESNRIKEQTFLRGITDNYNNILKFTMSTSTDGNLVQIYPDHPFIVNNEAIEKACKDLGLDNYFKYNTWLLLKTFARGGTAHEAFHILFTDFEMLKVMEKEFEHQHSYKHEIMHSIMNIGEDSYIELAGINYLPGLEFYISFSNRVAFHNTLSLDIMQEKLKQKQINRVNLFLHWAMMYAITGEIKGKITDRKVNSRIKKSAKYFDFIRKTKDCMKRYEYAKKIFLIIEDLVDDAIKEQEIFDFNYFKNKILPKLLEGSTPKNVDIKKDFKGRPQHSSSSNFSNNKDEQKESNKSSGRNSSQDSQGNNEQNSQDKDSQNSSGSGKQNDKKDADNSQEKDTNSKGNGADENKDESNDSSNKGNSKDDSSNKEDGNLNTEANNSQNSNKDSNDNDSNRDDIKNNHQNSNNNNSGAEDSNTDRDSSENRETEEERKAREQREKDEEKRLEKEAIDKLIKDMEYEQQEVQKEEEKRAIQQEKERELEQKIDRELQKVKYSSINKGMYVNVIKKFSDKYRKEELYKYYHEPNKGLIRSFSKSFQKLIKDQAPSWKNKLVIGSQLDTRRLADPKRRNWKRQNDMKEQADLNIMIVVDGSGSMEMNVKQVIQAVIMIYEVAKELDIPICVVEERAYYHTSKIEHKVLVDYNNYKKENTKYNILHLNADEGTREGVSLKWCHAYQKMQPNKDTLMIVIADGNPEHSCGRTVYSGTISASDTKKVADDIQKQGTNLVAIALGEYCYPHLKQIYKHTILCDNLSKLPKQMIRILEKNLFK